MPVSAKVVLLVTLKSLARTELNMTGYLVSNVPMLETLVEEVPDAFGAVTVPALIVSVSPLASPKVVLPFALVEPLIFKVAALVVPVNVAAENVPLVHCPPGPKLGVAAKAEDAHTERTRNIFFI
jgi:hypothetical protein